MIHLKEQESLAQARRILSNGRADEPIRLVLAENGYSESKLLEGDSLLAAAEIAVNDSLEAKGLRNNATDQTEAGIRAERKDFNKVIKVLRAVYRKEPAKLEMLGINESMARPIDLFLERSRGFFAILMDHPEIIAKLEEFGWSEARREGLRQRLRQLTEQRSAQLIAKGETQLLTQRKRAALKALDEWVSCLVKIARMALSDQPAALEKLGIAVATTRKPRKKGAKAAGQQAASPQAAEEPAESPAQTES